VVLGLDRVAFGHRDGFAGRLRALRDDPATATVRTTEPVAHPVGAGAARVEVFDRDGHGWVPPIVLGPGRAPGLRRLPWFDHRLAGSPLRRPAARGPRVRGLPRRMA